MREHITIWEIDSLTDQELWKRLQNGDKKAFELIYKRFFHVLAQYGYKIARDPQLIEDAIQDVFIDIWRRSAFLSDVENPKFYLFKALRHKILRNTERNVFEKSNDIDDFLDYLVTLSEEHKIIDREHRTEQRAQIKKAISNLSPRQQEVISLRFFHGLSIEEIGSLMTLSKQAVHNLVSRSYAVLRMLIQFMTFLPVYLLK